MSYEDLMARIAREIPELAGKLSAPRVTYVKSLRKAYITFESSVLAGESERGILICGTGIGMSMVANRHRGIRAALCHDAFTARMSREHNDANALAMGAGVVGENLAKEILFTFLDTPFSGAERHQRRIDKISAFESQS